MSSGFVPAGSDPLSSKQDDAWLKAQQLVAQSRSAASKPSKPDDGKSLYDVLQQNKAAKQEAFEEAARLKNQFRSLDDDEVEFLDSVLESTREKEASVRKETAEQLEVFRKQREAAEKAQFEADNTAPATDTTGSPTAPASWAARSKKRRRDDEAAPSLGAKLRRKPSIEPMKPVVSSDKTDRNADNGVSISKASTTNTDRPTTATMDEPHKLEPTRDPAPTASLGLGDYSSDDD